MVKLFVFRTCHATGWRIDLALSTIPRYASTRPINLLLYYRLLSYSFLGLIGTISILANLLCFLSAIRIFNLQSAFQRNFWLFTIKSNDKSRGFIPRQVGLICAPVVTRADAATVFTSASSQFSHTSWGDVSLSALSNPHRFVPDSFPPVL